MTVREDLPALRPLPSREAVVAIWHELFALKRDNDADRAPDDLCRPRRAQCRDVAALKRIAAILSKPGVLDA